MKVHSVKCWPGFFNAVDSGRKPFDYRKDDRGYGLGDMLELREWDPLPKQYSGRVLFRTITYILRHADGVGVPEGYCVLGFGKVS